MSRVILCCLLFAALGPNDAAACECSGPLNAAGAHSASVIFQGRVTRITLRPQQQLDIDFYRDQAEVEFEVVRAWRGDVAQRMVISTGLGGGDCGFEFRVGWVYVVPAEPFGGVLSTGICSGVEDLWSDPPSLPVMDSWVPPPTTRSLPGRDFFLRAYTTVAGLMMVCLVAFVLIGHPRHHPES